MSNKKISQLPLTGAALITDEYEINQLGNSKKITASQIISFFNSYFLPLTGGTLSGNILFEDTLGVDSVNNTDTLNIGITNSSIINIGRVGATVNIIGNVINEDVINLNVSDKLITLNDGGAASTGFGVGFEIEENSIITGYFKTNSTRNGYSLLTPAVAFKADLSLSLLTADRVFSFPDTSGTLLTNTTIPLSNTKILVGNASNLAAEVDLTLSATGGTFALSNTGVLTFPNADSVTRGLLTSTDWSNFNSKVSSTRTISTTVPLQGGGDLSANRTFSITQSGVSTDGYLSSIDWNTFNNKFNLPALTNGSVLFSNGTTISQNNSNFFWDNTNIRLGIGTAAPTSTLNPSFTHTAISGSSNVLTVDGIINQSGASSATYRGLDIFLRTTSSNTNAITGALIGGRSIALNNQDVGAVSTLNGFVAQSISGILIGSPGTTAEVQNNTALVGQAINNSNSTVATATVTGLQATGEQRGTNLITHVTGTLSTVVSNNASGSVTNLRAFWGRTTTVFGNAVTAGTITNPILVDLEGWGTGATFTNTPEQLRLQSGSTTAIAIRQLGAAHQSRFQGKVKFGADSAPVMAVHAVDSTGLGTGTALIEGAAQTLNIVRGWANMSVMSTDTQALNKGGSIGLGGYIDSGVTPYHFGAIGGFKENGTSGNSAGYLTFYTGAIGFGFMLERMRISSEGLVSIGRADITTTGALLNLAASTTSKASLNIQTGTAPTSPMEGDWWFDTTQRAFQSYNNGIKRTKQSVIFTQTASVTFTNNTTENNLFSTGIGTTTLPANILAIGKTLRVTIRGTHNRTSGTFNFKVRYGGVAGTILAQTQTTTGIGTTGTDGSFTIFLEICCRTLGATGTVFTQGEYTNMNANVSLSFGDGSSAGKGSTAAVTIDTTTSNQLVVTCTTGTASTGNNITVTNASIEILN